MFKQILQRVLAVVQKERDRESESERERERVSEEDAKTAT